MRWWRLLSRVDQASQDGSGRKTEVRPLPRSQKLLIEPERPASSGRRALAEGVRLEPKTSE